MNFFTFIFHVVSFQFKQPLFIYIFFWGLQTRWLDRSGFVKRLAGATTQQNPIDPVGRPMTRVNLNETFFFKCGFSPMPPLFSFFFSWLLTLFKVHYINIRKIFYFFMWDLKPFSIYTLCSQEKNYFFNVGFEALFHIYSMFIRKKIFF